MTGCQSDVITLSLTDSLLFLVDLIAGYWKDLLCVEFYYIFVITQRKTHLTPQ